MVEIVNRSGLTVHVAGEYLGPRASIEISAEQYARWISEVGDHARMVEREYLTVTHDTPDPEADVETPVDPLPFSVADLADRLESHQYTSDGRPRVAALESILGRDVTAQERDDIWAAHLRSVQGQAPGAAGGGGGGGA